MGKSINKVILVGRLGRDPELKYTASGTPFCRFSMATDDSWTDKGSGERTERTEWHNIVVWDKLAEICNNYLTKGKMVYIEGSLQTREWDDQEGNKRKTTEIRARDMMMLGGPGEGGGGSRRPSGPSPGGEARVEARRWKSDHRRRYPVLGSRAFNQKIGDRPVFPVSSKKMRNDRSVPDCFAVSTFAGRPDQGFHVLEVDLQRALPLRRQTIGRSWDTALKGLLTHHVLVLFQLSGMDAQIAVRRFQEFLQFVEGHRLAAGKSTHNAEADRLMDDSIQFRSTSLRRPALFCLLPDCMTFRFLSRSSHHTSWRSHRRRRSATLRTRLPAAPEPRSMVPGAPTYPAQ